MIHYGGAEAVLTRGAALTLIGSFSATLVRQRDKKERGGVSVIISANNFIEEEKGKKRNEKKETKGTRYFPYNQVGAAACLFCIANILSRACLTVPSTATDKYSRTTSRTLVPRTPTRPVPCVAPVAITIIPKFLPRHVNSRPSRLYTTPRNADRQLASITATPFLTRIQAVNPSVSVVKDSTPCRESTCHPTRSS